MYVRRFSNRLSPGLLGSGIGGCWGMQIVSLLCIPLTLWDLCSQPVTVVKSIKYILNFIRAFRFHSVPSSHFLVNLKFLKYEFFCQNSETQTWEFPGSPVLRTRSCPCWGPWFSPVRELKIPEAMQHGRRKTETQSLGKDCGSRVSIDRVMFPVWRNLRRTEWKARLLGWTILSEEMPSEFLWGINKLSVFKMCVLWERDAGP